MNKNENNGLILINEVMASVHHASGTEALLKQADARLMKNLRPPNGCGVKLCLALLRGIILCSFIFSEIDRFITILDNLKMYMDSYRGII